MELYKSINTVKVKDGKEYIRYKHAQSKQGRDGEFYLLVSIAKELDIQGKFEIFIYADDWFKPVVVVPQTLEQHKEEIKLNVSEFIEIQLIGKGFSSMTDAIAKSMAKTKFEVAAKSAVAWYSQVKVAEDTYLSTVTELNKKPVSEVINALPKL